MPLILRKIRKARWYKNNQTDFPWLLENDIPADPLGDLATNENALSVWQIDDDKSNFPRVAAALAANCDDLSNLDYAIFDQQVLKEINIVIRPSKGNSPDEIVNQNCHSDLVELSARQLVNLAKAILTHAELKRISEKEILHLLTQAVVSGQIERPKLRTKIGMKIDKYIALNKN
ncbi:hypothetical protein L0337_00700 [candidate division KSB1 bacterium]|nr:hypothetical protein [candidate division KSB1 bacterium]